MYLDEGLGVRSIALALNQRGVKTRRGREWSMVTIRDILRNHSYIGTYHRFGLRIPSSYEAIVGTEDFRLVQERMRNRSPGRRHAKADPFLLSGMLYCRACGQRMLGVTRHQMWRRKDGERVRGSYRYYQCQSRINRNRCEYRTRRAPELEAEVIRLVSWPTDETVYVDEGADGSKAKEQVVARERLKALSGRYRELVQRAGDGMLTLAQLREALEGVEAERSVVNRRLATVDGNMQQVYAQLEQQRVRLENEWEQMSPLEQREVLTSLVSRINLSDNGLEVILRG
jgi:site-specific DNA recombinase